MSIADCVINSIKEYIRGYRERNNHPGEESGDKEKAERFWRMWRVEYAQAGDEFLELWLHWKLLDEESI